MSLFNTVSTGHHTDDTARRPDTAGSCSTPVAYDSRLGEGRDKTYVHLTHPASPVEREEAQYFTIITVQLSHRRSKNAELRHQAIHPMPTQVLSIRVWSLGDRPARTRQFAGGVHVRDEYVVGSWRYQLPTDAYLDPKGHHCSGEGRPDTNMNGSLVDACALPISLRVRTQLLLSRAALQSSSIEASILK